MRSLRARILALGIGSAAAVLLLLAVPVAVTTAGNAQDSAERDASTLAQGVADYISTGSATSSDLAAVVDRANGRRGDTPVTVLLADGTVLGAEQSACSAALTTTSGDDDASGRGGGRDGDGDGRGRGGRDDYDLLPTSAATVTDVAGGRLVSIRAADGRGEATVCALVDDDSVRASVLERLAGLGLAGVGVLLAVAAIALLVARRLARHLTATAQTADRLGEGDLSARAPESGPTEVRRVGAALNRLAGRIDELLVLERETVADLSHRLRTPMMAVRLDVESLPASPAKAELEDHLAQLERTLTAVIQAARRPQREGALPHCELEPVVRERFNYWAPLMEDQGRETTLRTDRLRPGFQVRCAREDLVAALDALLENAVAHTPEGTSVAVAASVGGDGWARLDVLDRGPGVSPTALQRGRSDRGSSGLGLDIARACAEATGGSLELGVEDGWPFVRLLLGPA